MTNCFLLFLFNGVCNKAKHQLTGDRNKMVDAGLPGARYITGKRQLQCCIKILKEVQDPHVPPLAIFKFEQLETYG